MSSIGKHHQTLTNGVGKCSVPMWCGGGPAGFCDHDAYGGQTEEGRRWTYPHYVPALACPMHGGPARPSDTKEGT